MCIFQYPKFSCGCFSFPEPYYRCPGADLRAKTKIPIVCKVEGAFIPVIKTVLPVPGECHECRSQRRKIREEMLTLDPATSVKAHHEAALRRLEGRSAFHDVCLDTDNGRKTPPYERRWSWDFTDEEQFTVRKLTAPGKRRWSWDFDDEEQFTARKSTTPCKRRWSWDFDDEEQFTARKSTTPGKRRWSWDFDDEEQFTVRKRPTPPQEMILACNIFDEAVSLVEASNGKKSGKQRLNMENFSTFTAQAAKRNGRG